MLASQKQKKNEEKINNAQKITHTILKKARGPIK